MGLKSGDRSFRTYSPAVRTLKGDRIQVQLLRVPPMNALVMADVCPIWSNRGKVAVRKRCYCRPVAARLRVGEVPCGSGVIGVDRDAFVVIRVLIVSAYGHKIVRAVASNAENTAGGCAADDRCLGNCP